MTWQKDGQQADIRMALDPAGPRPGRRTVLVTALSTDRCYGGPEEGGWWYDSTYIVGPIVKCRESRARKIAAEMATGHRKHGRSRYSVIGTPDAEVIITDEDYLVSLVGGGRPHYE